MLAIPVYERGEEGKKYRHRHLLLENLTTKMHNLAARWQNMCENATQHAQQTADVCAAPAELAHDECAWPAAAS